MIEEWKPIKGFENYEVSNYGRVKRNKVEAKKGKGNYAKEEMIIADSVNTHGYHYVVLYKNKKKVNKLIHRLVAEAFIPNPKGYTEVNHKTEDSSKNAVWELEWISHKDNINYGTRIQRFIESAKNNPNMSKAVIQLDKNGAKIARFPSAKEVERTLGIGNANIISCCRGKRKTAGGYGWMYAESEVAI